MVSVIPAKEDLVTFSRIRKSTVVIGASLTMILGQTPLAGSVAASGPWTPTFTLAPAANAGTISDLSAAGKFVASAWVREGTTPGSVWVRESLNSGTTWLPPVRLAANPSMWASEISLTSDTASGAHFAVWQESIPSGSSRIFMSKETFGSGSWAVPLQVSDNPGTTDAWVPSIVVTPPYYFVSYTQTLADGSNATGRLRVFDRSTGQWGPSINLGNSRSYVKLAATANKVALVWSNSSWVIKLRRGTIGSGSSPSISWSTSSFGSGETPFIVLSGARGVVGWVKNGDVVVRRTTNSGAAWSLATTVLNGSAIQPYALFDAAMSGQEVVFTGQFTQAITEIGSTGTGFRMTSSNGGATWTQTQSHPFLGDNRQVAYTTKPSYVFKRVAEAWTQRLSDDDGGPDKLMYHRHT